MQHSLLGYAVGICFAALFYREAAGETSKGILVSEELIGNIDMND